jgi:photoactive yellow protein
VSVFAVARRIRQADRIRDAPCTNVQAFAGKFREGVAKGDLHTIFPYRFDFEMAPRDVTVTLFYSQQTGGAWVFVRDNVA